MDRPFEHNAGPLTQRAIPSLTRRGLVLSGSAALAASLLPQRLLGAMTLPVLATAQEASPAATPIPVAELPEPTDDGIEAPVLGIAFGSDEIVATPEVAAGTERLLTAVPYEDFGSIIFRIPEGQPAAIDEVLGFAAQPDGEVPAWLLETYFPGGVRTDYRYGTTAEGFVTLLPGTYGVIDFATGQSTTFVATAEAVDAIDPKDLQGFGASFAFAEVVDAVANVATVEIAALDSMTYTGLEGAIPAGRQLWQLTNEGEMVHNIYIFSTPEGTTADDILESIMSEDRSSDDGTSGGLMSTQTLSPGAVNNFYLDLQAGHHAAMCTESTNFSGPPHFFMGMIVTFEVA